MLQAYIKHDNEIALLRENQQGSHDIKGTDSVLLTVAKLALPLWSHITEKAS